MIGSYTIINNSKNNKKLITNIGFKTFKNLYVLWN